MFVHKYACDGGGRSVETKRDDIGVDFFTINGIGSLINSLFNRFRMIFLLYSKISLVIRE